MEPFPTDTIIVCERLALPHRCALCCVEEAAEEAAEEADG